MAPPAEENSLPPGLRIQRVAVRRLNLRVAIRPGEGTPLLFLNGIGANLELALPLLEALPGRHMVVFDMPGTGESETPVLPMRMSDYARVTREVLQALDYRDRIDLAGVSWGGFLAQQYAMQYMGEVRRLILAATSPGFTMFPAHANTVRHMATRKRYLSADHMARIGPALYGGLARRKPDILRAHANEVRPPSARGYLFQLMAANGFTSLPWLYRLKMPTLVLAGDDDPLIPLANARLLQFMIPRSRLQVIGEGGHMFLTMRASETASHMEKFLKNRYPLDGETQP